MAAAGVAVDLTRVSRGNFSNVKGTGAGVFELKIDFGPGYRVYFGKDGERLVILVGGKYNAAAERRDRDRAGGVGRVQTPQGRQEAGAMALTKAFRETVYQRAQQDGAFRKALLTEAVNAYLCGDETTGKRVLRNVINATMGFEQLAADMQKPSKSLHRMLGPNGNPNTANFLAIVVMLQERVGMKLKVRAAQDRRGAGIMRRAPIGIRHRFRLDRTRLEPEWMEERTYWLAGQR